MGALKIWCAGVKKEGIMDTIKHGSKGMDYLAGEMPAMELDEKDAKAIASYVMAELSSVKKTKNPQLIDKGKELFESYGLHRLSWQ